MAESWSWGNVTEGLQGGVKEFIRLCNVRFKRLEVRLRLLQAQLFGWHTPEQYGAAGDAVRDDTAAVQAAVTGAGARGVVLLSRRYRTTSAITVSVANQKWVVTGYENGGIIKAHTGNGVTVSAAGWEAHGYYGDADVATSATYAQGAGIKFAAGSNFPSLSNLHIKNIDACLDFDADGGKYIHVVNGVLDPYTQTAGSEGRSIYLRGTDTGAMHRRFVNCVGQGIVDFGEVYDTLLVNGIFRRPVWTSAAASITLLDNCVWGALGQAMTINGVNTVVRGCRFSGDVTLSSGMTGACAFTDNIQTSGTFTDSTSASVCLVRHHPLSVNYHLIDKHRIYSGSTTGGVVRTGRTVAPGDAAYTWNPYEGVSEVLYNTTLTTGRAVTLGTTDAASGVGLLVRRTAGGAYLLDVGGLVNLAPMEWCRVVYTGSAYVVVAAGKVQQVGTLSSGLRVAEDDMSGTTQYGLQVDSVTQSDATTNGIGVYARTQTAAAAFTQGTAMSLYAANPSAGAGSTITTAVGLHVENITAGSTNIALRLGTGNVGFHGVTPIARPAALTQTYSTADRTLSAYTPDSESGAYTGIDNAQAGTVYATVADLNALRVAVENLRAFTEDLAQHHNAVVDDLQAYGLEQ